jgi:hypothetical protein
MQFTSLKENIIGLSNLIISNYHKPEFNISQTTLRFLQSHHRAKQIYHLTFIRSLKTALRFLQFHHRAATNHMAKISQALAQ